MSRTSPLRDLASACGLNSTSSVDSNSEYFQSEFVPLSHSSTSTTIPGPMQSLDCKVFCRACQEPAYRELRYRSDFRFVGSLRVCQQCRETIFDPVVSGPARQDCRQASTPCRH